MFNNEVARPAMVTLLDCGITLSASALPRHSGYSEAIQHSRETCQKSRYWKMMIKDGCKVVKEEEEKLQGIS
jgi:hypothetical protein